MAVKKTTVSVALATYNEAQNLDACLTSVKGWADEIIIVDGGSTDKTLSIAKQYDARVITTTNPPIFHINKQKALDACTKDWILQLDADEVVPEDLRKEMLQIIGSPKASDAYYIPRKNYFVGHWLSKGGQYPDYVIRLFKRGKGHFPCKSVHEQISVSGSIGYLQHPMFHYTNRTYSDYWRKADLYTSLTAQELSRQKVPKNIPTLLLYMAIKPLVTFLKLYIRHKGFMDGVAGFRFALYSGMHYAIAYKKYLNQKN